MHRSVVMPVGPTVDPTRDQIDFGLAQAQVFAQILDADVAIVPIGRHFACHYLVLDAARPRPHFLIRRERHGPDRAGHVTLLAVLLDDWSDVLREGHRPGIIGRLLRLRRSSPTQG
jgi:hypothetical protein